MKHITLFAFILISALISCAQDKTNNGIYLLVRGDDIGSSHAANMGCIESYQDGIVRSVELMPCCPWFLEAINLLNDNPGLDVGIHLALTSEWSQYKWRPLTCAPSLVDSDGYFYPMVWQQSHFPPNTSIQSADWKLEEIEQELRAQIELSLKYVPYISHLSGHMGFAGLDSKIGELMKKLAKEYHLEIDMDKHQVQRFKGWEKTDNLEERIDNFCKNLKELTPGYYLFVDHPGKFNPEMKSILHKGYENVAIDRDWVTEVFTSEKVKQMIEELGIQLISYKDLK